VNTHPAWTDLDATEQRCLRQIHNGNIRRHRTTRHQSAARQRLALLGLIYFTSSRRWRVTPRGEATIAEGRKLEGS
jgi:hypothetical protein